VFLADEERLRLLFPLECGEEQLQVVSATEPQNWRKQEFRVYNQLDSILLGLGLLLYVGSYLL